MCRPGGSAWGAQLAQLPGDGEALLCCFFPMREEVIVALRTCPELQAALSTADALFVDLGCGDGRVSTRNWPGVRKK